MLTHPAWLTTAIVVASLLGPVDAWAMLVDCPAVQVFPKSGTVVPTNFRVLLQFQPEGKRGSWMEPFLKGDPSGLLWLVDEDGRVDLRVHERKALQVLLVPTRELRPNSRYVLRTNSTELLQALDRDLDMMRQRYWPQLEQRETDHHWRTAAQEDIRPSVWLSVPATDGVYDSGGLCGRSIQAILRTRLLDEWGLPLVRVDFLEPAGRSGFLLELKRDGTSIGLGWEHCASGQVGPGKYRITLTAVDLAGNESRAPGTPLVVVVPGYDDPGTVRRRDDRSGSLVGRLLLALVLPFAAGYGLVSVSLTVRSRRSRLRAPS